jgi:ABC-2 type transport system permease protein
VAYCLLPASVGALLCLLVTVLVPRRRNEFVFAAVVAVLLAGVLFSYRAWRAAANSDVWLLQLLRQMQVGNLPFLPSNWISKGLLAATFPGGLQRSLFFLGVLVSNSLLAYLIAAWAYARYYRYAYDRVHSHNFLRKRRERSWLPGIVNGVFGFLPSQVRVLIVKDVRTFSRDPVQSLQLLIFTGLIALYIVLLSRVTHYAEHPYWRNMISFLNLSVMALFLTVFTSRFVFPLLSLEGQRLWILGLCPIGRDSIMWGKFVFSAAGAMLLTSGLMLLSSLILDYDPLLTVVQFTMVLILACGVSGISVGLGARFANRKETDPSRIASGIAGTVNLVTSLFFIVLVISAIAVPYHFYSLTLTPDAEQAEAVRHVQRLRVPSGDGLPWDQFRIWLAASLGLCLAVGSAAVLLPMRLGIRAFRRMEV